MLSTCNLSRREYVCRHVRRGVAKPEGFRGGDGDTYHILKLGWVMEGCENCCSGCLPGKYRVYCSLWWGIMKYQVQKGRFPFQGGIMKLKCFMTFAKSCRRKPCVGSIPLCSQSGLFFLLFLPLVLILKWQDIYAPFGRIKQAYMWIDGDTFCPGTLTNENPHSMKKSVIRSVDFVVLNPLK